MPDFKKIIESVPQDYQRQKQVNGILHKTYFFETWSGYSHPVHLDKPLSYAETQNRGDYGYYEASLDTSVKVPQLILVENYYVKREQIIIEAQKIRSQKNSVVYYLFHKKNDRVILGKEVNLDETFETNEYIKITFNAEGSIKEAELLQKIFEYSYAYEYDKNGMLIKVTMKNTEGTKILEKGKGL